MSRVSNQQRGHPGDVKRLGVPVPAAAWSMAWVTSPWQEVDDERQMMLPCFQTSSVCFLTASWERSEAEGSGEAQEMPQQCVLCVTVLCTWRTQASVEGRDSLPSGLVSPKKHGFALQSPDARPRVSLSDAVWM